MKILPKSLKKINKNNNRTIHNNSSHNNNNITIKIINITKMIVKKMFKTPAIMSVLRFI